MITKIAIKNFKPFKEIDLSLSNLNVLSGLNGSGKSSVIQSLLLLRQSFKDRVKSSAGLILDGDLVSLGSGKDVFYQYASKNEKIEFEILANDIDLKWCFEYVPNADSLVAIEQKYDNDLSLSNCSLFNNKFQYLNAEHISPQEGYKKSEFHVVKNRDIGTKGQYAAHYLSEYGLSEKITPPALQHPKANTNSLIHQIDSWISEISPGVKFIAEDIKGLNLVRLAIKFETKDGYTNDIKPINTGFGITYILPVVLAILKAQSGDILIIENPESHLHPRGQSTIGSMIAYAAQAGVNIFVETHSDHIINGIRLAVKQGKLATKNVKILYFERVLDSSEQYSNIKKIRIDKNGELSAYPKGFLDEWNEQLMALI